MSTSSLPSFIKILPVVLEKKTKMWKVYRQTDDWRCAKTIAHLSLRLRWAKTKPYWLHLFMVGVNFLFIDYVYSHMLRQRDAQAVERLTYCRTLWTQMGRTVLQSTVTGSLFFTKRLRDETSLSCSGVRTYSLDDIEPRPRAAGISFPLLHRDDYTVEDIYFVLQINHSMDFLLMFFINCVPSSSRRSCWPGIKLNINDLKGHRHDWGKCLFTKIMWHKILIEFLQKVIQKCTNHFGKDWAINRAEITHKSLYL